MTTPKGIQAIRDNANARLPRPYTQRLPTVAQLNALLNLTEALAGALDGLLPITPPFNRPERPDVIRARAALDKYREFK